MIHIKTERGIKVDLDRKQIRQAVETACEVVSGGLDMDLTILFCGDASTRRLNLKYRGVDKPTDVLSFPADEVDPQSGKRYLGDVMIALTQANRQAMDAGHPLMSEVLLLCVHGVLHLLGYDHADRDEKERMWGLQESILSRLGLAGMKISEGEH